MNAYSVVSSIRLRCPINPTVGIRLAWLSRPCPIHGIASIVYPGCCQLSFGREQLNSRGSLYKGDTFVRFMGGTFARGGSFHTFRLIWPDQSPPLLSKIMGTTLHGGIVYFVTQAPIFLNKKALLVMHICTYLCMRACSGIQTMQHYGITLFLLIQD